MSETIPPVMVEFTGNATKGVAAATKMTTALERFAKSAKAAADAATAAFAAMEKGAAAMESVAAAADVATKAMRSLSRASNAVAKSTEKAATAAQAGMASIATATERMAASVDTATTAASTGIAAIGAESRATAAGLRATSAQSAAAGASLAASGRKAEGMGMSLLGLGPIFEKVRKWGTIGLLGIGIIALDLGAKFQTAMTKLSTAAGAPIAKVEAMKGAVLSTAQAVGMSGTEMATALYHPVSAGLTLAASLQAVKYAAMEAKISGASLEDTTYGLSSVMKAYNLNAKAAGPTMASLNAIVGQGDMRFQDLNQSVKNWVPTAATFGVSLNSAGAALAYFTDRGDTASTAGTKLSLIMTQMAGPSKQANTIYKALGLTTGEVTAKTKKIAQTLKDAGVSQSMLAADLKKPDGIVVALQDLKKHLEASGMSAAEANSALVRAFGGGKNFKGVAELLQNVDGVKTKFDDISRSSSMKVFQAAWVKTTKTLSFQFQQIKTGAENLGIKLGTALIPQVSRFIDLLESRGKPVVKSFSDALSGIASGFSAGPAKAPAAPKANPFGQGGVSKFVAPVIAAPPPLTAWQKVGKVFADVTKNLETFGSQVGRAFSNLLSAAQPTLALLGGAGLATLRLLGGVLAHIVGPALVAVTGFMARHKTLVEGLVVGYLAYKGALLAMTIATKTVELATKAAAAAQVLWNAAMDANPIGAAIVIIGALALAVMYCWQHFQGFRNVVMDVFASTAVAAGMGVNLIVGFLKTLADATLTSVGYMLGALGHLPGFGWAKQASKDVLGFRHSVDSAMDGVVNKVNSAVAWVNHQKVDVIMRGRIDDLSKKIADAKKQLSDKNLPVAKRIALMADINNWTDQVNKARLAIAATPSAKQAVLTATITDWTAKIAAANKALASAPASKKAFFTADISDLTRKRQMAQAELNSLQNKTVTITSLFVTAGSPPSVSKYVAKADGGIRFAANGLVNRQATMARAGSNILWAEESTGGESYIPHAASKRARSRVIAAQTVGILGGQVQWGSGGSGAAGAAASYAQLGAAIPAGVAAGVSGSAGAAHAAVQALAKGTVAAFSAELGIASPSKKFRSLGAYVTFGLVQGLTGSTASVKAASKRIASALYVSFGSGHSYLQHTVARDNRALLTLAARRDAVAVKLKAANKALAAAQKQWAAEQKQVADSIMQSSSVVMDASQNNGWLSATQVVQNFQQQQEKAIQFAGFLRKAQGLGLNSAMIAQIANSGVDAGYATAQALSSANKGQIAALNGMQKSMQGAANGVGNAVADSMYGAGIRSAQGLVKGLQSQERAIEAQMMRIAKSMQAAIKRALGIRSPSRVFADLGVYIPKGLAQGIHAGTPHATGAVMSMSRAVAGVGQRQYAYAGASPRGGGTTVINNYNVEVTVQGSVTSERNLADAVQARLLRKGANNSQTWQPYHR